ncbi:hypothetical protein [uncultured Flavobacterium sp.]|uniref:hypothetical protein n=1 Tax=uncultured Flavobacterium sp. TaxID=165435 RepID=UPI0030ECDF59
MSNKKPFHAKVLNVPSINMGAWRLDDLSVSPDGKYLALASILLKNSIFDSKTKLEVYDLKTNQLKYTYYSSDLKQKLRVNSSINYGDSLKFLQPYKLGFIDNKTLIVQIQPYVNSGVIPKDSQLQINLGTDTAVTAKLVDRGDVSVITALPSKSRNSFEIRRGVMYVDNVVLNRMPTGLSEQTHDEVLLK